MHVYFLVYAFALILCAVAEYFVSAKRFADRGKPPALAGLAPFSLLLAGAAHWYQPRSEGAMPDGLDLCFRRASRSRSWPGTWSSSASAGEAERR